VPSCFCYSKIVCFSIFEVKAKSAFSIIFSRSCFSSSESSGFPSGWRMATAGIILGAPYVLEIAVMAQMWTVGIPALSISLLIVAPQRVHVPQVEVRITALI
jgi:hypothetical protein